MVQIFANLTNLPTSAFQIAIVTQRRMATVSVEVRAENAGAAGNLVVSTLENDPNYLTSQDPSLGRVDSVSISSPPQEVLPVWAIVLIAVGGAVLIAGAIIIVILIMRRRQTETRSMYVSPQLEPNPAYQ